MNLQKLLRINIPNAFSSTHCSSQNQNTNRRAGSAQPASQPAAGERLLQLKDQFCLSRRVLSLDGALVPDTAALSGDFDFLSSDSYILFQETKEETSTKTFENVVKCSQLKNRKV